VLIGISGPARAGKDTFANFVKRRLYEKERLQPKRYAFAAPIKYGLKAMFGWTEDHVDGELKDVLDERLNIIPREAMQGLGDWGRTENLWLMLAREVFAQSLPHGLVISDVRTEFEADWIRSEGGAVVVLRSTAATTTGVLSKRAAQHRTEVTLAPNRLDYHTNPFAGPVELEIEAIRFAEWFLKQRKLNKEYVKSVT